MNLMNSSNSSESVLKTQFLKLMLNYINELNDSEVKILFGDETTKTNFIQLISNSLNS